MTSEEDGPESRLEYARAAAGLLALPGPSPLVPLAAAAEKLSVPLATLEHWIAIGFVSAEPGGIAALELVGLTD